MMKKENQKNPSAHSAEFSFFVIGSVFVCLLLAEMVLEIFFTLHVSAKIFLIFAIGISYYIAAFLYSSRTKDLEMLRIVQFLLFAFYIAFLLDITLSGKLVGRLSFSGTREEYLELHVNFRPFATIKTYLVGFWKNYVAFRWLALNILGNLFLLTPLSLFLPILLRFERRWYIYLPTILLISASVEALQYLFMAGSCDVDDLILNFIGATLLFFLWKIPPVRGLIRKATKSEF